jgi:Ca2+/H+ antiporter
MIEVLVAYTLYIIILTIPFLVITAIAAIFLAGIAATVTEYPVAGHPRRCSV